MLQNEQELKSTFEFNQNNGGETMFLNHSTGIRFSLALLLAGLLVMVGSLLDKTKFLPQEGAVEIVGLMFSLAAAGIIIVLAMLAQKRPSVEALASALRRETKERREVAEAWKNVGFTTLSFRQMSPGRKAWYLFFTLFGVAAIIYGLVDFTGIMPEFKMPGPEGETATMSHWLSGALAILVGTLALLMGSSTKHDMFYKRIGNLLDFRTKPNEPIN